MWMMFVKETFFQCLHVLLVVNIDNLVDAIVVTIENDDDDGMQGFT